MVCELLCKFIQEEGANILSISKYRLGHNSPPGFACVIMLDESHCSAHSYADEGLLAFDFFTCGQSDPYNIFEKMIKVLSIENYSIKKMNRFIYSNGE